MLKIRRTANGHVLFTLSGRIEVEDVAELKHLLSLETTDYHQVVLDLKDVTLVSPEAVRFLARCEADSVKLANCPPYIREWIEQETARAGRRNEH